ncbi:unnamed protein product [Cyprideis torosa]|uniref:Uncharacterized protein n=1 Tax=Cyprideis torosa TaxID=163714 RepID=A0A7R8WJQ1_9CRUS|nr:unnamed protein product [Cyprideis torosa]CAG0896021.1 unnamed protein product [Cyprideis torosa]
MSTTQRIQAVARLKLSEVTDDGVYLVDEHKTAHSSGPAPLARITANTLRHDMVTRTFESKVLKDNATSVSRTMTHKPDTAYAKYLQLQRKKDVYETASLMQKARGLDVSFTEQDISQDISQDHFAEEEPEPECSEVERPVPRPLPRMLRAEEVPILSDVLNEESEPECSEVERPVPRMLRVEMVRSKY